MTEFLETEKTPIRLSDLRQTPKRPAESMGDDVPHGLIYFQKKIIKEMDTMKSLNKVAKRKFEDLAGAFVSLSGKNPPSCRDDSELAIELLKDIVLILEKQLIEKDILINVPLKVKFDIAKKKKTSTKIAQVSPSESRAEMTISNCNNGDGNKSNTIILNKNGNNSSMKKKAIFKETFC